MSLFTFPLMWIPLVLLVSAALLGLAMGIGFLIDAGDPDSDDSTAVRRRPENACGPSAGERSGTLRRLR